MSCSVDVGAGWWCRSVLLSWFGGVNVGLLVSAAWRRWNYCCKCLLLVDAGACLQVSAAWGYKCLLLGGACSCCLMTPEQVMQVSAASLAGRCVVSWYLPRDVVRRPEAIFRRLSEIALIRAGYDFWSLALKRAVWKRAAVIGLKLASAALGPRLWLVGVHVGRWLVAGGSGADPTLAAGRREKHRSLSSGKYACFVFLQE